MNPPAPARFSAATAGWLAALLFFGWLAFLFVPGPAPQPKPAPVPIAPPPPSRLAALGLPDNPDLDALPGIFALYADKAEWVDGRTKFSYWNPGSQGYSYFFEATRANGSYHFRAIPEPHDADHFFDESMPGDWPIRFYLAPAPAKFRFAPEERALAEPTHEPVKPKQDLEKIKPPPLEMNLPPLDLEQKK